MKREIVVTKNSEPWWGFPWVAWLEREGEYVPFTLDVGITRRSVLRKVRWRIDRYVDNPKPPNVEIQRERLST